MFITFEGLDGSGKTTQVQSLYVYLKEHGYDVLLAREPGGTALGNQIRQVLLDAGNWDIVPATEVLLFSASRAQLVREVIEPALERGTIVLCDRFADSTIAYQGYGYQLDLGALRAITSFATNGLTPDLTLYLNISVEAGLQRKHAASMFDSEAWNRLDQQTLDFHRRVRQGYLALIDAEPERWQVIDAGPPAEVVQQEIRRRVEMRV